ncbi:MAG: dihydropteroate synthase [Bacteroidales bacterium]|nr:dihydropteroate synthase [Bacteroidales bacterium]
MSNNFTLKVGNKELDVSKPRVMGILNLTLDSFYDGGRYKSDQAYLTRVEKMLDEGAAIIDIGATSTRPGAQEISEQEELQRLIGPLLKIRGRFPDSALSLDTYRSSVASKGIAAGAHIINDISGGTFDQNMFSTIAELKIPYIMMHIKGTPRNMQIKPVYENVVDEVAQFFKVQLKKLADLGISSNVVLDPGFGFGKRMEHNYKLLQSLKKISDLGFPVLAGLSRKSMINKILQTSPANALNGTTTLNTIALLNGANILRVHDVKEAVEVVKLVNSYLSFENGTSKK